MSTQPYLTTHTDRYRENDARRPLAHGDPTKADIEFALERAKAIMEVRNGTRNFGPNINPNTNSK